MRSTRLALVALSCAACGMAGAWAAAQESGGDSAGRSAPKRDSADGAGEQAPWRLFDDFDGKLALDWEIVRRDETLYSLAKRPGKLSVTTSRGDVWRNMDLPSNLFVVEAPDDDASADFVVTTCLDSFTPAAPWQQAGLLLYDDDDNFVKWVRQFSHLGRRILDLTREVNGKAQSTHVAVDPDAPRIWLRLTKRGRLYEFSSSTDGQAFTVHGELPWGERPPKRLGLLAVKGGDCPAVDVHFDFFEVRPLTPEEKQDPRTAERRKLLGTWKAVSWRASGKRIEKAPLSQLIFELPTVTVAEGTQTFQAEYTLDLAKRPARILLSTERAGTTVVVTWIYAVDKDTLLICFDPRPGAPVPGEFDTRNGDGRLLITFARPVESGGTK